MLSTPTVQQIPTSDDHVFAFRIAGEVREADINAMGRVMNDAFDAMDGVRMLLILEGIGVEDAVKSLTPQALVAEARALWKVDRYAVVGAPAAAAAMINFSDLFIPVKARTFKADELAEAWAFVGAEPTETPAAGFGQAFG
jgi:hypothetical protein